MSEFGPWLFATVVLVCLTVVFVSVPGARRWFGYLFFAAITIIAVSFLYMSLGSQKDSSREHASLSQSVDDGEKTVVRVTFFPTPEMQALLERQIGKLDVTTTANGKVSPIATIGDLTRAATFALEKGENESAKEIVVALERLLSNRFIRYRLHQ